MTDETRPFAEAVKGGILLGSLTIYCPDVRKREGMTATINAAMQARERRAAVKALREAADSEALKDDFGHGEVITKHDVRTALRAEAAAIERVEVAP